MSTALSLISGTTGAIRGALALLRELREMLPPGEELPDALIRHLFLENERNLAVLEALPTSATLRKRGVERDDPRLFAFADALVLEATGAALVEWNALDKSFGLGTINLPFQRKEWADVAKSFDRQDLLGAARYIVTRGEALAALGRIDSAARTGTLVRLRLVRLRSAMLMVRTALRTDKRLAFMFSGSS